MIKALIFTDENRERDGWSSPANSAIRSGINSSIPDVTIVLDGTDSQRPSADYGRLSEDTARAGCPGAGLAGRLRRRYRGPHTGPRIQQRQAHHRSPGHDLEAPLGRLHSALHFRIQ